MAAILANPLMIKAYLAGIPGKGKSFPDGAKMAKIPAATVPGTQHHADFMVKDSKRCADSGGWGWAVFDYDTASDTFKPGTLADKPPQGNDAKYGFACHTSVKTRDYVFTGAPASSDHLYAGSALPLRRSPASPPWRQPSSRSDRSTELC
jgi:Cytochrome P460